MGKAREEAEEEAYFDSDQNEMNERGGGRGGRMSDDDPSALKGHMAKDKGKEGRCSGGEDNDVRWALERENARRLAAEENERNAPPVVAMGIARSQEEDE